MSPIRRWIWKITRTAHLYSTLLGVTLLTFFAVTGFMLNHEHWFIDQHKEPRTAEGSVQPEMFEPINVLAFENMLRRDYGATGPLEPVDLEDNPLQFRFLRPGRRVEARISRPEEQPPPDDDKPADEKPPDAGMAQPVEKPAGKVEVVYYDDGTPGILVDLHKGKNTGRAWKLVIDAVCILMVIVAITGLVLWSSLRGRSRLNYVMFVLGIGVGFAVYFVFVP